MRNIITNITSKYFDKGQLHVIHLLLKNVLYLYYMYEVNILHKHTHTLTAMYINYFIHSFSCDKIYLLHHSAVIGMITCYKIYNFNSIEQFEICRAMINCEFSTIFLNNYFILNYIKKNKVILINNNITDIIVNNNYYDNIITIHKICIVCLFIKLRVYDYFMKIITNENTYIIGKTYPPFYIGVFCIYIIFSLHVYWTYEIIMKFIFGKSTAKKIE